MVKTILQAGPLQRGQISRGIIEGRAHATAKQEPVVIERAHDLAGVVDAVRDGVGGGGGVEESRVSPKRGVEDKALKNRDAAPSISPDDLTRRVDAVRKGADR
jgi:hypothetical protein